MRSLVAVTASRKARLLRAENADNIRVGGTFVRGSDPCSNLSLYQILSDVTLYWFTNTFATSLYHYRTTYGRFENRGTQPGQLRLDKPLGYSQFPREMLPTPASWVREKANLVFHRRHKVVSATRGPNHGLNTADANELQGGHFAALEQPVLLWNDVWEFIQVAWTPHQRSSL